MIESSDGLRSEVGSVRRNPESELKHNNADEPG